jgi:hypothetical protein
VRSFGALGVVCLLVLAAGVVAIVAKAGTAGPQTPDEQIAFGTDRDGDSRSTR